MADLALPPLTAPTVTLPMLRRDIRLLRGPRGADGAPTWTLHDPAANRFFRIGWRESELLARWRAGETPAKLIDAVNARRPVGATEADVDRLLRFLAANQLLAATSGEARRTLAEQARRRKTGAAKALLHHYLFFRIPLLRPDPLLAAVGPWLSFLFRPWFWVLVATLGALGTMLVLRRWDEFLTAIHHFATPRGVALYLAALVASKILHEFAHALACWRHGVRVPSVGIAFMVLWPILYTDATGAWALVSRRARLQIAAAGILAELAVSATALFAWAFLPDGPVRAAAFFLATTSWLLSLAVNLNPFMRFDGYYLLSDAWGMPNLQERSFALGRWALRKALLGLDDPPPENLPRRRTALLILYAFGVWIYRFFLFLAIALLVYHFVVKVVGIFLMAVEIVWFILRPIAQEMAAWWERRGDLRPNARLILFLTIVFVGLPLAATVPLPVGLSAPGTWRAAARVEIFAPLGARIEAVRVGLGEPIEPGDVLLTLSSPDLDVRIATVEREIAALTREVAALSTDQGLRGQLDLARRQLERAVSRRNGLIGERDRLVVRAPAAGVVVELDPYLTPGRWVGERAPLALIADTGRAVIEAYVPEAMRLRLEPGLTARFEPEDPERAVVEATIRLIDDSPTTRLDAPLLASVHGGSIPVQATTSGALIPHGAYYRVRLEPAEALPAPQEFPGRVIFRAEPASIADRLWRSVAAALIRESGF